MKTHKQFLCAFLLIFSLFLSTACRTTDVPDTSESLSIQSTEVSPENTAVPPTIAPEDTAVPEVAPNKPQSTWTANEVSIPVADGLEIAGTLTLPDAGEPVPTIILLHMLGGDHSDWDKNELQTELNTNGFGTLAVDLRGHGATGGAADWEAAETDLQVVWQFLRDHPGVDGQATAVVGASIGANLGLRLAANVPQIDTAVLLSPGFDYQEVTTEDALENYGERPLFYVAGEGDTYAAGSTRVLFGQTTGPKQIELLENADHGTNMLIANPALVELVVAWLDEHVATGDPDVSTSDAGQSVFIERPDLIELQGTLFGDGSKAVVFANMNDNISQPWTETAVALADAGYMALTFDYRAGERAFMDERDDDLLAAIQYAIDQGAEEIVVIGASIGGAATIKAVSAHPDLPIAGIIVIAAPSALGDEAITAEDLAAIQVPQLYMTSENDHQGLDASVERLYAMAADPKAWQTVPGSAHGTEIFATAEGALLQTAIIDFVNQTMPK